MVAWARSAVLLAALLAVLGRTVTGDVPGRPPRTIAGPPQWVSFSADTHRIADTDGATFVGRTYRNHDGSVRTEEGRPGQGLDSIFIKSHARSMSYHWSPELGWQSWPLTLAPEALQPQSWVLNDRIRLVPEPYQGYQVLATAMGPGRTFYLAPALNFYTVARRVPCRFDAQATCGAWLSNIAIAAQPPELFVPPDGV